MAKILASTDILRSGSIGPVSYLRSKYWPIISRAKSLGPGTDTNDQILCRSAFSNAVIDWSSESNQTRTEWDAIAFKTSKYNMFGNYRVNGRSLFISASSLSYLYNSIAGSAIVAVTSKAPAYGFYYKNDIFSIRDEADIGNIYVTVTNPPYDIAVIARISPPYPPTRNSPPPNIDQSQKVYFVALKDQVTEGTFSQMSNYDKAYFLHISSVTIDGNRISPRIIARHFYASPF